MKCQPSRRIEDLSDDEVAQADDKQVLVRMVTHPRCAKDDVVMMPIMVIVPKLHVVSINTLK